MIQQLYFLMFNQRKKKKNTNLQKYVYHHVHCNIVYNGQDIQSTYVSVLR